MSPPTFNLIDEPWLPCLWPDGSTTFESLRTVLRESHRIHDVQDPSPMVTVSLLRLLITVVHRINPIQSNEDWKAVWDSGRFDPSAIDGYLDRPDIHDRFDLFHPEHPFFQVADFTVDKPAPISQLAMEEVSGNNPVLFDHQLDETVTGVDPGTAARLLLALQYTSIGFGQSAKPSRGGTRLVESRIDFSDAPLARGGTLHLYGDSLFQTLLLNTLLPGNRRLESFRSDGSPVWEWKSIPLAGSEEHLDGYLDYLTWPARWVRLMPEEENGRVVVRRVMICQGVKLALPVLDPFKRFVSDKKEGVKVYGLSAGKALWRDSATWLELSERNDDRHQSPQPLEQVSAFFSEDDTLDVADREIVPFRVYGFGAKPGKAASIEFWRVEELAVPRQYLLKGNDVSRLKEALGFAEQAARELRMAVRSLGRALFEHESGTGADKNKVDDFTNNFAIERRFWPTLEQPFNRLLMRLPVDYESAQREWGETIVRQMEKAFKDGVRGLPQLGRDLRAVTKAEGKLHSKIHELKVKMGLIEVEVS